MTWVDYILLSAVALFIGIGAWRGLSGELAHFCGLFAATASVYFGFIFISDFVRASDWVSGSAACHAVSVVLTVVLWLVVFALVRVIVNACVSFVVPQPLNAVLGGAVGACKGVLLLAVLCGIGLTGTRSDVLFRAHSAPVRVIAEWADAFKSASGVQS